VVSIWLWKFVTGSLEAKRKIFADSHSGPTKESNSTTVLFEGITHLAMSSLLNELMRPECHGLVWR
jgi:hypothetical protein